VETPNIHDTNDPNPVDMDTPKSNTAKLVRVKAIVNSEIVMQGDATISINNVKDHNADIATVALIEHEKEDTKAKSPNKKKPLNKKMELKKKSMEIKVHDIAHVHLKLEVRTPVMEMMKKEFSSGVKVFFVKDVGLHNKYMILNCYQTFCTIQLRRMTLNILLVSLGLIMLFMERMMICTLLDYYFFLLVRNM